MAVKLGKTDFIDDPGALEQHLPGKQISSVERFGKFMLLRLTRSNLGGAMPDNGDAPAALLVHLGMTGMLAAHPAAQPCQKHTHVCLLLDDGRELRYRDARRFGRMVYVPEPSLAEELREFGADPLEVDAEEFAARIQSRNTRIKALLLDQRVLRGVGNIYADESLWRARIHPARLGSQLSKKEVGTLRKMLRQVLQQAIALGGSSIADFLNSEGRPGNYQRRHRAYGREGQHCYRCGTTIGRMIVAGRSSCFCPKCQKNR